MDEVQAEDIMEHLIDEANEWWNELESEEMVNIYLKNSSKHSQTKTIKRENGGTINRRSPTKRWKW